MSTQKQKINFLKRIENWTEEHKFWAECIRTIVFGFAGAIAIATYFESLKNRSARKSEVDKAKLAYHIGAIKEVAEKSYKFNSISVRYFEGSASWLVLRDAYDDYRNARHTLILLDGDTAISKRTDHTSVKMLEVLAHYGSKLFDTARVSKDSVTITRNLTRYNAFENIRDEIKRNCDAVELVALKNL